MRKADAPGFPWREAGPLRKPTFDVEARSLVRFLRNLSLLSTHTANPWARLMCRKADVQQTL
jgi:hypothetical protein